MATQPHLWRPAPLGFAWAAALPGLLLTLIAGLALGVLQQVGLATQVLAPMQFVLVALLALALIRLGAGRLDRGSVGLGAVPLPRLALVVIGAGAAFHGSMFLIGMVKGDAAAAEQSQAVARLLGLGESVRQDLTVILVTTVFAPLGEELAYRGLVFRGLRDGLSRGGFLKRAGGWPGLPGWIALLLALAVSGLGFIGIHGGEGQDGLFLEYAIFATVMALSYHATGSILVPIFLHGASNAITIYQTTRLGDAPVLSEPWLIWVILIGPLIPVLLVWLPGRALPDPR